MSGFSARHLNCFTIYFHRVVSLYPLTLPVVIPSPVLEQGKVILIAYNTIEHAVSHKVSLKVGTPIILCRNLNSAPRLCNGTRLHVTFLTKNSIESWDSSWDFNGLGWRRKFFFIENTIISHTTCAILKGF